MSEDTIEFIMKLVIGILMTLINALFIMWFWNDGLVGAIDGVHSVDYPKALMIYLLVYSFIQPVVRMQWGEK